MAYIVLYTVPVGGGDPIISWVNAYLHCIYLYSCRLLLPLMAMEYNREELLLLAWLAGILLSRLTKYGLH